MALRSDEREFVEKLVQNALARIPEMLHIIEDQGVVDELQIQNKTDYLIGYILGTLLTEFREAYTSINGSRPVNQVDAEAHLIIYNRLKVSRAIIDGYQRGEM